MQTEINKVNNLKHPKKQTSLSSPSEIITPQLSGSFIHLNKNKEIMKK